MIRNPEPRRPPEDPDDRAGGLRRAFEASRGFLLDGFQRRALDALDAGRSVLVAAPTGSGKTLVAEYAVARSLAEGGKAFYTTPLKALSNQKYRDFARALGEDRVGLLTGDNSRNGEAPVVVMTTEVLRNMIYANSPTLAGLRYVILDEVHYLQDRYRGAVWEEVIIHLKKDVDLVCLSATVSNAEELASWLETVRGRAEAVIEERRPVELRHLYLVGDRSAPRPALLATLVGDGEGVRPNAEASRLDSRSHRSPGVRGQSRGRLSSPGRVETVELLNGEEMLPAIVFVFSRAGCDQAVQQCLSAGLRLTSPEEREGVRAIAARKVSALDQADLEVLGYGRFLTGLEAGLAAHHAGLVPPMKEAVEEAFAAGLVKVVFATETLSLGINMPARTVVIEKLTKFGGERHAFLTPGEYTQLTGRAGRRGIDELGYAVVPWSPFVPFEQVAGLATNRSYALVSSFRPTYNMAVNLIRRYPPDTAHRLLNLSFAQYRADREVVHLERELERRSEALEGYRLAARCELGDVEDYRRRGDAGRPERRAPEGPVTAGALDRLQPGDVVDVPRFGGRAVVLQKARSRGGEIRLLALSADRSIVRLGPTDLRLPLRRIGTVELPRPYAPRSPAFRRAVAASLGRMRPAAAPGTSSRPGPEIVDTHPVAGCPDLAEHLRWAERADRLQRDVERLEGRVKGRTESLARQFDRVLRVLEAWGYVDGWSLGTAGSLLASTYSESDLLVCECVREGLLAGLDAASVAALASCFTYETRGPAGTAPGAPGRWPSGRLRDRFQRVERIWRDLEATEREAGLPPTRPPDPGFVVPVYRWALGRDLEYVLEGAEMTGGDFVRNTKQLIDLLRQMAEVAPDRATAACARLAVGSLFRGVVAASGAVA